MPFCGHSSLENSNLNLRRYSSLERLILSRNKLHSIIQIEIVVAPMYHLELASSPNVLHAKH